MDMPVSPAQLMGEEPRIESCQSPLKTAQTKKIYRYPFVAQVRLNFQSFLEKVLRPAGLVAKSSSGVRRQSEAATALLAARGRPGGLDGARAKAVSRFACHRTPQWPARWGSTDFVTGPVAPGGASGKALPVDTRPVLCQEAAWWILPRQSSAFCREAPGCSRWRALESAKPGNRLAQAREREGFP